MSAPLEALRFALLRTRVRGIRRPIQGWHRHDNPAVDHKGALVYLAPSRINLQLTLERCPDIPFRETREHAV
jgi:peptide subunit release factor RF-3